MSILEILGVELTQLDFFEVYYHHIDAFLIM